MKKNGRLVAIALGSVLCASCVGGAFLVAGSTPAAETVRAAETAKTYSWITEDSDYKTFFNSLSKTENINGVTWSWTCKGNKAPNVNPIPNNKFDGLQIGSNGTPFPGGTLTASFANGDYAGYSLKTLKIKAISKSGSVSLTVKSGDVEIVSGVSTPNWTNNLTQAPDWQTFDVGSSEDLEITFSESDGALYLCAFELEFEPAAPAVNYDYIEIEGEPSKTKYIVGDTFLTDGLSVVAYSSTDESAPGKDVTSQATWEVETFTDGDVSDNYETVVMASVDGFEDAVASYIVSVGEPATVLSLSVSGIDTEKTYSAGDIVDLSQAKITAHMSDGSDYDATYDLALEPYTITLEDAYKGSVELPLEFKGVTTSIVLSTELSNIESVRVADEGAKVSTKGLVTGKFSHSGGYSIFIEDEGHAIMLYGVPTTLSESVVVGDIIAVSGSKTDYSGLAEIEDVDGLYIASTGNEVNPTIIDDVTSSALTDWDSRYIQVSGLTKNSGSLWTGSNRSTLVVKHSSGTIGFYCSNNQIAEDLQYQLDDFFTKIDNLSFTFAGHVGWFKTSAQLNPTSIDEFSCPDYDAVMAFINACMQPKLSHDDIDEGNACLEWYPKAKQAMESLTEAQKDYFLTSKETADYAARYNAWAAAYGDGATSSLGTIMSSNDTAAIIALVALSSATVAAAGFMIASRRRKAK